jgi:hypothetical protein
MRARRIVGTARWGLDVAVVGDAAVCRLARRKSREEGVSLGRCQPKICGTSHRRDDWSFTRRMLADLILKLSPTLLRSLTRTIIKRAIVNCAIAYSDLKSLCLVGYQCIVCNMRHGSLAGVSYFNVVGAACL